MQQHYRGSDDLAKRLEAYAAARLAPDPAAMLRLRARIMDEAGARLARPTTKPAAARLTAPHGPGAPTPIGRRAAMVGARRRIVGALLAAAIALIALSGVAAAARPGGPLFGLRLWVETVSAPSDPAARVEADIRRLDERVAEAIQGAGDDNRAAVAAALAAYRDIVDDALAAADGDADRTARLEAALERHLVVLRALLFSVPLQAREAIERAIERSGNAVDSIGAGFEGNPGSHASPVPNGPGATEHPTPHPAPTDHPGHTPPAPPRPDHGPDGGTPDSPGHDSGG